MPRSPSRPQLVERKADIRRLCDAARRDGQQVALVPTMGALHEGHLQLVDMARRSADLVVVSIFINPTQFGPGEDLERYPQYLAADLEMLGARGVDIAFTPDAAEMYPPDHATSVRVRNLTEGLCGAHRPGHFDGVATVVTKLFNIIGPCTAVFGRKDYQQLKVIQRLVHDLDIPVHVVDLPTVREPDGLALSSRNAYLTTAERSRALELSRGLAAAHALWTRGARAAGNLRLEVSARIEAVFDKVDYVTAADPETLEPLDDSDVRETVLLAAAAQIGSTRLIDNTVLGEDDPPIGEPRDG